TGLLAPSGGTWMTSTIPAFGATPGPLPRAAGPAPAPAAPAAAAGAGLQAVLLDMDGTLVDTEGFWWDVEVEVFASLGHTLDDSWRHVVVGGPMTRSAGFLIEATGADITLPELTVLLNDGFEARIDGALPLMPGAERLLAELSEHRVPTALVSASHRRIIDRVMNSLGRRHFGLSVAGDEVPRTEPHPDPYLAASEGLGADPAGPAGRVSGRRGGPRGRRGRVRGRRGHRDRGRRRRGRGLPGRGGPLRRPHRAGRRAHRRTVAGSRRPDIPARSDDGNALDVHPACSGLAERKFPGRDRMITEQVSDRIRITVDG